MHRTPNTNQGLRSRTSNAITGNFLAANLFLQVYCEENVVTEITTDFLSTAAFANHAATVGGVPLLRLSSNRLNRESANVKVLYFIGSDKLKEERITFLPAGDKKKIIIIIISCQVLS